MSHPERWLRGLALLELLVGLAVGMLVLAAALGALGTLQHSSKRIQESLELQETADSIFQTLGFQITHAGAQVLTVAPQHASRVVIAPPRAAEPFIQGTRGGDGADTLTTWHNPFAGTANCLGQRDTGKTKFIRSTFYRQGNRLMCRASGVAVPLTLARNVHDFQVRYAERQPVPEGRHWQWRTAQTVQNWRQVAAVSVCLQLHGSLPLNTLQRPPAPDALVRGCDGLPLRDRQYLALVNTQFFFLRNAP